MDWLTLKNYSSVPSVPNSVYLRGKKNGVINHGGTRSSTQSNTEKRKKMKKNKTKNGRDAIISRLHEEKKSAPTFYEKVYEIVRQIPKGKVTSYGAIAEVIGMKGSS